MMYPTKKHTTTCVLSEPRWKSSGKSQRSHSSPDRRAAPVTRQPWTRLQTEEDCVAEHPFVGQRKRGNTQQSVSFMQTLTQYARWWSAIDRGAHASIVRNSTAKKSAKAPAYWQETSNAGASYTGGAGGGAAANGHIFREILGHHVTWQQVREEKRRRAAAAPGGASQFSRASRSYSA